jgi:hypothetical protein
MLVYEVSVCLILRTLELAYGTHAGQKSLGVGKASLSEDRRRVVSDDLNTS